MHYPKPDFTQRVFSDHAKDRLRCLEGLPLATFRQRAIAFSMDWALVFFAWLLLLLLVIQLGGFDLGKERVISLNQGIGKWTFLPAALLYFAVSTRLGHGRTLGKHWMRIRIVSLHQRELTLWTCVERFLGYGASTLEFGFGFLQYYLHPNRQTVHDRIAETIVVSEGLVPSGTRVLPSEEFS